MKNENQPGSVNPALSEELFHKMTEHTNQVYKFVKIYNDYANEPGITVQVKRSIC